jgi:hypothetical protein
MRSVGFMPGTAGVKKAGGCGPIVATALVAEVSRCVEAALIEVDENALTELLYCRQPISMLRDRRATHGRLDVSSMA